MISSQRHRLKAALGVYPCICRLAAEVLEVAATVAVGLLRYVTQHNFLVHRLVLPHSQNRNSPILLIIRCNSPMQWSDAINNPMQWSDAIVRCDPQQCAKVKLGNAVIMGQHSLRCRQ